MTFKKKQNSRIKTSFQEKYWILTKTFEVEPSVMTFPLESCTGLLLYLKLESKVETGWEFKRVPLSLPISTSAHFEFYQ